MTARDTAGPAPGAADVVLAGSEAAAAAAGVRSTCLSPDPAAYRCRRAVSSVRSTLELRRVAAQNPLCNA
ncbi:hypothetical protein GCM10018785_71150 [Streptomyces longispororuber]|uniref:Uncharacterized protein n=1 Tax=Streptomyces longispororuber TaxID=68230 RepID=A0A919AAJ9_9ACTN|nr:hypothetical protein GCM10018785_71150 [Streptomyces longispororuber]